MNHYNLMRRASIFLDGKLKDQKEVKIESLELVIQSTFGLGSKFVNKRLEKMERCGFVMIDKVENTVSWVA